MFHHSSFSRASFSPQSWRFDEAVAQQTDDGGAFDAPYREYVERIKQADAQAWRASIEAVERQRNDVDLQVVGTSDALPVVAPALEAKQPIVSRSGTILAPAAGRIKEHDLQAMIDETDGALLAFLVEMLD